MRPALPILLALLLALAACGGSADECEDLHGPLTAECMKRAPETPSRNTSI
jgi:hypothetical protein